MFASEVLISWVDRIQIELIVLTFCQTAMELVTSIDLAHSSTDEFDIKFDTHYSSSKNNLEMKWNWPRPQNLEPKSTDLSRPDHCPRQSPDETSVTAMVYRIYNFFFLRGHGSLYIYFLYLKFGLLNRLLILRQITVNYSTFSCAWTWNMNVSVILMVIFSGSLTNSERSWEFDEKISVKIRFCKSHGVIN